MFPQGHTDYQTFLSVIMVGMAAGGVASYAPVFRIAAGYVLTVTLPIIIRLSMELGVFQFALAGLGLVFAVVMILTARRTNRTILQGFEMRFENPCLKKGIEPTYA